MAFMAVSLEKEEKSGDVQLQKKSFEINNASLQIRSNGELRDFLKANFNTTNFKCPWTNNGVTKGQ